MKAKDKGNGGECFSLESANPQVMSSVTRLIQLAENDKTCTLKLHNDGQSKVTQCVTELEEMFNHCNYPFLYNLYEF